MESIENTEEWPSSIDLQSDRQFSQICRQSYNNTVTEKTGFENTPHTHTHTQTNTDRWHSYFLCRNYHSSVERATGHQVGAVSVHITMSRGKYGCKPLLCSAQQKSSSAILSDRHHNVTPGCLGLDQVVWPPPTLIDLVSGVVVMDKPVPFPTLNFFVGIWQFVFAQLTALSVFKHMLFKKQCGSTLCLAVLL